MIDFVWNDILLDPMTNALIVLSNALFDNYGLAIIAFTLVIRFVTYPLTLRQLRTTRAMQEMQPRMQEIQKKYKDPKRRQQELMKVYREVGFNPLGCLLPFVIQIPIWIALFQVVRRTLRETPEDLLGLSSHLYNWDFITTAVPLDRGFLWLDLGNPSFPLAVLVALATFVQQKLSTARSVARDDRSASMNRTMLWAMPLIFGWFTFTVPSGLGLYWLTTSIFTVITAYFYNGPENFSWRWLFSMDPLPAPTTGGATKSSKDGGSSDAGRDDEADDSASDGDSSEPQPTKRSRRRRRRRGRRGAARQGARSDNG